MTLKVRKFAVLETNEAVERVTISGGGLTAQALTYGATLQSLKLDGFDHSLVLGAASLEPYLGPLQYFGAMVGRCANRIANGQLEIDGKTYHLDQNFLGLHTLHGGTRGTSQRVWACKHLDDHSVTFCLSLIDGDMGFPGNLTLEAKYSLPGHATFQVDVTAHADAVTPVSIAHHSYFNLQGYGPIRTHILQVHADKYLPVDDEQIPTGDICDVAGTPFDFRSPRTIENVLMDHNFCLAQNKTPLREVANLYSPESGISMKVMSTEPGLQVFNGKTISRWGALDRKNGGEHDWGGIALEPQAWPDAPHHANFPSALLRPGQIYRQCSQFIFTVKGSAP